MGDSNQQEAATLMKIQEITMKIQKVPISILKHWKILNFIIRKKQKFPNQTSEKFDHLMILKNQIVLREEKCFYRKTIIQSEELGEIITKEAEVLTVYEEEDFRGSLISKAEIILKTADTNTHQQIQQSVILLQIMIVFIKRPLLMKQT